MGEIAAHVHAREVCCAGEEWSCALSSERDVEAEMGESRAYDSGT